MGPRESKNVVVGFSMIARRLFPCSAVIFFSRVPVISFLPPPDQHGEAHIGGPRYLPITFSDSVAQDSTVLWRTLQRRVYSEPFRH